MFFKFSETSLKLTVRQYAYFGHCAHVLCIIQGMVYKWIKERGASYLKIGGELSRGVSCPDTVCCPVPATLVCNRPNFLFMHGNFLIFLQETVHSFTFKMYGDRLPSSSTKEIVPFFEKLVSCPVSGQRVHFPAINTKKKFHSIPRLKSEPMRAGGIITGSAEGWNRS